MNLKKFLLRTAVALVFGPVVILSALYGRLLWCLVVLSAVLFSVRETDQLLRAKGANISSAITLAAGSAVVISFYRFGEGALYPLMVLLMIAAFAREIYRKSGSALLNIAATLFSALMFSLLFGSFILIREMNAAAYPMAGEWIVMIFLTTWVCDTAAYLIGSAWGQRKLMPRISPNKTIEGTIAGFLLAPVTAVLCYFWFVDGLELADAVIIGLIVGVVGQFGDLFESMLKRDAGVKDSSNLIPGHGGMLDRFDSSSFSAPLIYLYLKLFVL